MTKPTLTTPWRYLTPSLLALVLAVTLLSGCAEFTLPMPTPPEPAPEEPAEPENPEPEEPTEPQPEPEEPGQPQEPDPQPDPEPDPENPEPEPQPDPEPDPQPNPEPEPEPENPDPDPQPEPQPEPEPEPDPQPDPEPEPEPDPEPEPEPEEPAPEPEEPAPDPAPQPPTLRLMPMGDSVTYGDFSSEGNGYRVELAKALVQGDAAEVSFVGSQSSAAQGAAPGYDHEGYRGWVIQQLSELMSPNAPPQSPLLRYKPNLITLHAGTNDMKQDRNVAQAPQRLSTLIDTIFETLPDVTLVVATLVPAQDEAVNARINTYNQAIRKLVNEERAQGRQIVLADMAGVTKADLADNLHPNDSGYKKMARAFDKAVKKAIESGWFAD